MSIIAQVILALLPWSSMVCSLMIVAGFFVGGSFLFACGRTFYRVLSEQKLKRPGPDDSEQEWEQYEKNREEARKGDIQRIGYALLCALGFITSALLLQPQENLVFAIHSDSLKLRS